MHRKTMLMSLFVGIAVAFCLGRTTPAQAQATANTIEGTVDVPLTVTNPCTGDIINGTFTFHFVLHTTSNNNAGITVIHSHIVNGTAVSDTGVSYVIQESGNDTEIGSSTNEITTVLDTHVVSQGQSSNFSMRVLIHLTVNANGDVTANVDSTTTTCQ
jgi:hypothetical protein